MTTSGAPDLRSFLAAYESAHPEDVWRVSDPVDVAHEVTAYVLELERRHRLPMVIFEHLKRFENLFVANLFGTRQRIAFALGMDEDRLYQTWTERMAKLISPIWVESGPVQEVVHTGSDVNLLSLPVPRAFLDDGGPYISSGVCVARDPETGVGNLAFARMQVKGPDRIGISVHSKGHLWDYHRRAEGMGRSLEMAAVLGAHPAVMLAGAAHAGIEVDEYDIAGALQGQPVELVRGQTVDIGVPANAEIVLEGEILAGVREPEGPFGEYTGYSTARSTENVFQVRAITHRSNPIYLNVTAGFSSEHLLLEAVQKEANMLQHLRQVLPNIRAVHFPKSGALSHCYISMEKTLEGQPQQAASLLIGLDQYTKLVVVVDADVDVTNEEEVLWAMATRMQPKRDVLVIPDCLCSVLDPSSEGGLSSKMVVDATAPLKDWDAFRYRLPREVEENVLPVVDQWIARRG